MRIVPRRVLISAFAIVSSLALCASLVEAQNCRHPLANPKGSSRADVTVSTTAVTFLDVNTARCSASCVIKSTQPVRIAGLSDGAPTATAGQYVAGNSTFSLGLESQDAWQAIRDTSATGDSAISCTEMRP